MTELQRFMNELGEWADATFGVNRNPRAVVAHLKKEVDELYDNIYESEEYVDCLMLLLDAYRRSGGTADGLIEDAFKKLEVCKKRKWSEPNEEGIVEHVRE